MKINHNHLELGVVITDEETEAERNKETCASSIASEWYSQNPKLGNLAPEPTLSLTPEYRLPTAHAKRNWEELLF